MPSPYRTEYGDLADKQGNPIRAYRGRGLERIDALSVPLTAEEVLKAVSAHAAGLLHLNKEQLASLRLLGEAYRLWGARSEGVKASRPRGRPPMFELDESHKADGTYGTTIAVRVIVTCLHTWDGRKQEENCE